MQKESNRPYTTIQPPFQPQDHSTAWVLRKAPHMSAIAWRAHQSLLPEPFGVVPQ